VGRFQDILKKGNGIATENKDRRVCDTVMGMGVVGENMDRDYENKLGRCSSS